MADLLAIVSKSVFEKEARLDGVILDVGGVFSTERYRSKNKKLAKLAEGGSLFLVTVRPGDVLWLVAVLVNPSHDDDGWLAVANTTAIREISGAIPKLKFTTGAGITAAKGRLGMSLQTPRELTAEDVMLLKGTPSKGSKAAKATKPPVAKVAKKPKVGKAENTHPADPLSLTGLLARWEETRSPIVAEAIARVGKASESADANALRKRSKIPQDEWLELKATVSLEDRGALLATLLDTTSAKVKERIAALDVWGQDPRICDALHNIVQTIPWTSAGTRAVWTLIFKRLRAYADPRTEKVARDFDQTAIASSWTGPRGPAEWMGTRLTKLAEQIKKSGPAKKLAGAELEAIEKLTAGAPTTANDKDVTVLMAEVLANPDNDDSRLVLADALLIDGDPRGELIVTQHKNASGSGDRDSRALEKELLKVHSDSLIGPMARWVRKKGRRFRLGFLEECNFKENVHGTGVDELAKSSMLATLRVVAAPTEVLALPNLVHLEEMHVLPAWQNPELDDVLHVDRSLAVRHLRVRLEDRHLTLFNENPALKNLITLGLVAELPTIGKLLRTSIANQLETLYIPALYNRSGLGQFTNVVELVGRTQIKRVGLCFSDQDNDWQFEVFAERTASAWTHAVCKPRLKTAMPSQVSTLLEIFSAAMNQSIKTVEVRSATPLRESTRTALEQVLITHCQDIALDFTIDS